jgi:hypothetical protein
VGVVSRVGDGEVSAVIVGVVSRVGDGEVSVVIVGVVVIVILVLFCSSCSI